MSRVLCGYVAGTAIGLALSRLEKGAFPSEHCVDVLRPVEVSAFVAVSRDHLLVLEKLSKSLMAILNTILRTVDQDPSSSR